MWIAYEKRSSKAHTAQDKSKRQRLETAIEKLPDGDVKWYD